MSACNTNAAIRGKRKRLLQVLTDADNESVADLCRKANISIPSYYKYIKDPKISKLINEATVNACMARKPLTIRALLKQAEGGNIAAIRTTLELDGSLKSGGNQTVNLGVSTETPPTALRIDTPEQLEQAIAQCTAEMETLKELMHNLIAMRTPPQGRIGDGIHPPAGAPPHEEG